MKLREVTPKVIASLEEKSGYIVKVTEDPALPTLATIRQQNDYPHHNLWIGAQPVKNRPSIGRKSLSTDYAAISFVFLAVNMNVPFASLTPCGAVHIRAKYISWVHWWLSWISKSFEFASEPRFLQAFSLPSHG